MNQERINAAEICAEWSKDFAQNGDLEEAGLWEALAMGLRSKRDNLDVRGEGALYALDQAKQKAEMPDGILESFPDEMKQSMLEIRKEAAIVAIQLEKLIK
jgi:hypothetical protein